MKSIKTENIGKLWYATIYHDGKPVAQGVSTSSEASAIRDAERWYHTWKKERGLIE